MSQYHATIRWQLNQNERFTEQQYSRAHQWQLGGGAKLSASASPHIVPQPYSVPEYADPEEAFVASLSSCHMLFFLHLAAKSDVVVESYEDKAVGTLSEDSTGKMVMIQVILRPEVTLATHNTQDQISLNMLHHQAHELCFIANSVKTEVLVQPV
ncbi:MULTISPECIES: OsmC family protein [unclassified Pseudoalteromonas]|uniref:OsmC family protein n=1 Tax=unclassified Pseudoalteromonas TaxID=194690 RepID=UPI0020969BD6|nr:OsmC family protein [Pseudoalteromonas sp. XMcav2-N]MCO7190589.1 OsmC family protein [Pseudoalteromonas sp. XMcav2-N]